ncbi:MAG TPA: hypothetical protein VGN20_27600 [Mucilaginibacter sp.]|jgi:hypothetical protein
MNYKGINYDTGTRTLTGSLTREKFEEERIVKEIGIIKNELHCNAVRISGTDIERVVKAAEIALAQQLTVLFSPSLQFENQEDTFKYILQSAEAAETLRSRYGNLILVVGCELTLFTSGFIKGDTGEDRIKNMFGPYSLVKNILGIKRTYNKRLDSFLLETIEEVRKRFNGQVTYASGTWEKVNWNLFDLISIDHYRASYNKAIYVKDLQSYKNLGKPLCITEFGCCTYKGADDKGAMGWAIVDWKKDKPELKGSYVRDEDTQAAYLLELLDVFEKEKVFGAFVFTFLFENYIYDDDAKYDLDMASYGIVKAIPYIKSGYSENLPWIPKKAFYALGEYFRKN